MHDNRTAAFSFMLPKPLWGILLAAFLLRALLFVVAAGEPHRFTAPDSSGYWQLAANLAQHGSFSMSAAQPLEPDSTRTPGYPMFLALFVAAHAGVRSVAAVQLLISTLVCFMVMAGVLRMTGRTTAAAIAGILIAADIPSIVLANYVLTETLFTLILLAGVFCVFAYLENSRVRYLALAGVLFGLCSLCRPIALLFPFFLLLFPLFKRSFLTKKFLRHALVFVGIYLLSLAPWLARNNAFFGYPFLCSIGYDSLLYYTGAAVKASAEHISVEEASALIQKESGLIYGGKVAPEDLREINRKKAAWAKSLIVAHPAIFVKNFTRASVQMLVYPIRSYVDHLLFPQMTENTVTTWGEPEAGSLFSRMLKKTSLSTIALCGLQAALIIVLYALITRTFLGAFDAVQGNRILIMVLVVAFFTLMSGAPGVDARFRVPLMPFLSMLASFSFAGAGRNS